MARNFSFFIDDESGKLVERYEKYLSGAGVGYFDVDEMERIVEFYLAYGRTKDSMQALELGKRLHPTSSTLDMKRAKIYIATGDTNKALRILSQLVENSDAEVALLKIEALAKLDRTSEAMKLARMVVGEEDDDVDMLCLELAMIFTAELDFENALELLKIGYEVNPQNVDILFDMAFCQEQKHLYREAIQSYERLIDINTYTSEAWFNLGQIYFLLAQYEKAIESYDYAIVINEKDPVALLQKAHAYFQLGQWQQAIEAYEEYAELIPEKWQVWLFVGECYEKMENFGRALHYYKLSYNEMPDNYEALIGISICLLESEQYEDSLHYIEEAMKIGSEMADVWVYLAEANVGLGKSEQAMEAYLHAVSIDPNQPDVLLSLANIYMDLGDSQTALTYYETAYSFDATLEYIELFIAVASYYAGDYDKTATYLEQAIHRNFDSAKLFLELCPDADQQLLDYSRRISEE